VAAINVSRLEELVLGMDSVAEWLAVVGLIGLEKQNYLVHL